MRAVIGSVAVHALLAWLLFHGDREGSPRSSPASPPSITMVEAVEVDLLPSTDGGAPAGDAATRGAASAPATSHARVTPARTRAVDTDPRGAITIDHTDTSGEGADTAGDLGPEGRGMGRGGHGRGTGIGFGDGGTIKRAELLAPPPAPRGDPPSKARLAQLIYPTRQRDVEDAELFIARVIVDDDGFVAGAKLVRGFGGRRDEVASQMIWKFRYAPALDAGGHPIRSTLDQRFLVGP